MRRAPKKSRPKIKIPKNNRLSVEKTRVVFNLNQEIDYGKESLGDFLRTNLPDAECVFLIGQSYGGRSQFKYTVSIDESRRRVLVDALRDYCEKNQLERNFDAD